MCGISRQIHQAETPTFFKYVINGHKKMTHTNFQIFLEISSAVMIKMIDLALRALIDFFEIDTINYLIKKNFDTNFIMSKALFGVAKPKQNKNTILIIERSTFWVT